MGYTHFDRLAAANGIAVGAKNAETAIVNSAGAVISGVKHVLSVTFATSSAAQNIYMHAPVTGIVTTCWTSQDVAGNTAAYSVSQGSAGSNIATATVTSISIGISTAVALSATPGTSVTRGDCLRFARGVQGTAGSSTLTIVINQTA